MADEIPTPRRPRWPWLVGAFTFVQCTVLGWWLIDVRNYAIGDAMYRTLYAKQMVLSRDPHLASMGFYWMPLPTVSRVPFVLVAQLFDHAELAGPMTSALFAGLLVVVIARLAELMQLSRAMTVVIVGIFALSPITMYMGASGMSESAFGLFSALTLYFFVKWRQDGRSTTMVLMATALAGATLCRYEALLFVPVLGVAVAVSAAKGRRLQLAILSGFPSVMVFAWWTLASALIMDDPFFWRTASKSTTATPVVSPWLPDSRTSLSLIGYSVAVVLTLAPAFVAVIAGMVAVPKRGRTSLGLLGVAFAMPAVVTLQLVAGESWGVPRFYFLSPIMAVICVMWVLRIGRHQPFALWMGRLGVALLALGALSGSLMLSSREYAYAEAEFAFFGPLFGKDQAESSVPSGGQNIVYSGDLRPYRALKGDLDPLLADGAIAATQSLSIAMLFTDELDQYISPEDRDFEQITSDPIGRFQFVVVQPAKISAGQPTLLAIVQRSVPEGTWMLARSYADQVEVWEFVENGATPLLATVPPAEDSSAATAEAAPQP
jgi:Dolichyl-phosphate-mannose-protein mannosyltransferase